MNISLYTTPYSINLHKDKAKQFSREALELTFRALNILKCSKTPTLLSFPWIKLYVLHRTSVFNLKALAKPLLD